MNDRPVLIDEGDGPCPYCAEWASRKFAADGRTRHCDGCGGDIPVYPCMGGAGMQAVVPHHYHLRPIHGGPPGRVGVFQELCLECYVAHREKHFPPAETGVYGTHHPTKEEMVRNHTERRLRDEGRLSRA